MIQQKQKCHNIILTVIIYGIILNIILHFVEMPFLAWIKHMNGFQKGFWRYDRQSMETKYPYYPGLEVDVLDVVGIAVSGQTKLKNVRNTYKDE